MVNAKKKPKVPKRSGANKFLIFMGGKLSVNYDEKNKFVNKIYK